MRHRHDSTWVRYALCLWAAHVWIACGEALQAPAPASVAEEHHLTRNRQGEAADDLGQELSQHAAEPGGRALLTVPHLAESETKTHERTEEELEHFIRPEEAGAGTDATRPANAAAPNSADIIPIADPPPAPQVFSEPRWVQATAEIYFQNRTAEEARNLALQRAYQDAIEQVAGVGITVTRSRLVTETDDSFHKAFFEASRVDIRGHVTAVDDIRWEIVELRRSNTSLAPTPGYRVTLRAYVVPPKGKADAGFQLNARLNRVNFTHGDTLVLTARSTRGGYLTVFNVQTNGRITTLIPSGQFPERTLRANEATAFPSQEQVANGLELATVVPEGTDSVAESLLVVVTSGEEPPPLPSDGAYLTLVEVNRWVATIPQGERAIDVVSFDIRR